MNTVILSQQNLDNNVKYLRSLGNYKDILPELKSNAYGHGIKEIAGMLAKYSFPYICVHNLSEATEIHRVNPQQKILILGPVDATQLFNGLNCDYAIWSIEQLRAISSYHQAARFHLFVDSGMNREGFKIDKLAEFLNKLNDSERKVIIGVMSHFSSADDENSVQTDLQVNAFQQALSMIRSSRIEPEFIHISASSGLLRDVETVSNYKRTGISLYGISPLAENGGLKPVMKVVSKVAQVKTVHAGESIGYNATFTADKELVVAVIPIGFNDGVNRGLSNTGKISVNGKQCAILGRVSMNYVTFDVTALKDIKEGNEVIVVSDLINAENCVSGIASACTTTPYVIAVGIDPLIPRIVVD